MIGNLIFNKSSTLYIKTSNFSQKMAALRKTALKVWCFQSLKDLWNLFSGGCFMF